jgi:hypothetical protein
MQHFSDRPVADFVRGVSGPEISTEIGAHLAGGCPKCKTGVDAWSRVRKFATAEAAYEPPTDLVRLVKLGFAAQPLAQSRKWTLANLVFDGSAQPLPVGVRSAAISAWQVIYEADGLTVDLRLGRRAPSRNVHVVGQVFDKKAVRALQDSAVVELRTAEDRLLATTVVNAMGEFHLEFEQRDNMWLAISAEGRESVRIPLANPK